MPQKPVMSGPPPRAVEAAQKIAQAATMQAVGGSVPMGLPARNMPHPQQVFQQPQPPNMAAPPGPMAPPGMMRQQNPALLQQGMGQNLPQGMPPQSMPQPMQQTMPQQMQPSSGAPVQPNNPAALEWYTKQQQQQQQQMNHPNAMMNAGQQQFPQMPGGQQQGLPVGHQQNRPNMAVPASLQQLLYAEVSK